MGEAVKEQNTTDYPDGSRVNRSANQRARWVAMLAGGGYVSDEHGRMRYFESAEDAAAGLAECGHGPGRK